MCEQYAHLTCALLSYGLVRRGQPMIVGFYGKHDTSNNCNFLILRKVTIYNLFFIFLSKLMHMLLVNIQYYSYIYLEKYYLVDVGFSNVPGYLAPFKNVHYHQQDFHRRKPRGAMEIFNFAHSS